GVQKYFSSSNSVTTAIPGVTLALVSSTATPFTVSVSQNTDNLVSAVQAFTSAYNAAVSEINQATAAPVVVPAAPGSGGQAQSLGGGVLWGNTNAQSIVQQLTQIVSGFLGAGSSYNSLSQVGLQVSDTFQTFTASNNGEGSANSNNNNNNPVGTGGQTVQSTNLPGTDGTLQPLDTNAFLKAFSANQAGVTALLNGSNGLTTVLGTYLTSVTATPTLLSSGPVGTLPSVSIIQNFENNNSDAISQYQSRVAQITDSANQQASNLRSQFVASEALIAQLQAQQQELAAALGFTVSSSSSSGG
ncbi:MAG TPA: flagellar filament capping protein FliD, partial [Candidatus Cybelea sp.]|nr:flagellar filament capping protein FliD [Candidatus Cybelea sp.]